MQGVGGITIELNVGIVLVEGELGMLAGGAPGTIRMDWDRAPWATTWESVPLRLGDVARFDCSAVDKASAPFSASGGTTRFASGLSSASDRAGTLGICDGARIERSGVPGYDAERLCDRLVECGLWKT